MPPSPFQEFKRDYRDLIDDVIAFRRLGFASLLDLLRSWPDVVQVLDGGAGHGDEAGVRLVAVPDVTTQHMHKMVQKQKDSNSG